MDQIIEKNKISQSYYIDHMKIQKIKRRNAKYMAFIRVNIKIGIILSSINFFKI